MRTWLLVTLPALVVNAAGFPVGTYTSCAQGTNNPSGNLFPRTAGFQDGARLVVTESGATVTSTYVDQNGVTQALRFAAADGLVEDRLAVIGQMGQVIPGFKSLCVLGVGSGAGYPASLTVSAGALAFEAGKVFLTLTGELRSEAGACGVLRQTEASFWVSCENRLGAAPVVGAGPAVAAKLPGGRHACRTQIETLDRIGGRSEHVTGGGTGTLILTEDGARVTAEYSGDASLAGTLHLQARSAISASAGAGQTMMAPCMGPGRRVRASESLPVAAGSLSEIGSTLFLSFAGVMDEGSSCAGAQVAGAVICEK
jgi:hypothetical protein